MPNLNWFTFNEYQKAADLTAVYPRRGSNLTYPTLGLCGEAGEVANKVKKIERDRGGVINDEDRQQIAKEAGDVCWYLAALCTELGLDFGKVAEGNIAKLKKRQQDGTLGGSGDNR